MFLSNLERAILERKGLIEESEIERFLNPSYENDLHDHFLLPDMERACERIEKAIINNERIIIYADYDADGVPAGVLVARFFEAISHPVEVYIPERNRDGFGINVTAAHQLSKKCDLIITVDCGSVDHEAIDIFNSKNVDVIVTDHHHVDDVLPNAYAIVNPQRKDSEYPFSEICGSLVAWKLVQALLSRNTYSLPIGWEKWLLGMAAIGTICDMMPLYNENRTVVVYGLSVLRKLHWKGWKELCRVAHIEQSTLTARDIGFSIGPRINAASRLGSVAIVRELLLTDNLNQAKKLALELESLNSSRKMIVKDMICDAKKNVNTSSEVIVIGNESWKPSLAGLVASALADDQKKPAFVWGMAEDGTLKGSCRSGGQYNVVDLMKKCSDDLFTHLGGHTHAGGFAFKKENSEYLKKELDKAIEGSNKLAEKKESEGIPAFIGDLNESLISVMNAMEPFGKGNEEPVFRVSGNVSSVSFFGSDKKLSKGIIHDATGEIRIMSFDPNTILKNGVLTVDCRFEKNVFNSISELRLVVNKVVQ